MEVGSRSAELESSFRFRIRRMDELQEEESFASAGGRSPGYGDSQGSIPSPQHSVHHSFPGPDHSTSPAASKGWSGGQMPDQSDQSPAVNSSEPLLPASKRLGQGGNESPHATPSAAAGSTEQSKSNGYDSDDDSVMSAARQFARSLMHKAQRTQPGDRNGGSTRSAAPQSSSGVSPGAAHVRLMHDLPRRPLQPPAGSEVTSDAGDEQQMDDGVLKYKAIDGLSFRLQCRRILPTAKRHRSRRGQAWPADGAGQSELDDGAWRLIATTVDTSALVTGLSPNTRYEFRVVVVYMGRASAVCEEEEVDSRAPPEHTEHILLGRTRSCWIVTKALPPITVQVVKVCGCSTGRCAHERLQVYIRHCTSHLHAQCCPHRLCCKSGVHSFKGMHVYLHLHLCVCICAYVNSLHATQPR